MGPGQDTERLGLLDRLDIELASRAAAEFGGLDADTLLTRFPRTWIVRQNFREAWIVGLLALRGIKIELEIVQGTLRGRRNAHCSRQERVLIEGLNRALDRMLGRARLSEPPDGWFLVALFETVTQGLPRFTNNQLRRDLPWDGLRPLTYPRPDSLRGLLDSFTWANRYREVPDAWDREHPVRQGFRVAWRFARIAPLPDFNLMFSFVAMNAFHLASGYPLVVPEPSDKAMLERVVRGGVPYRIVQFESRLLTEARR